MAESMSPWGAKDVRAHVAAPRLGACSRSIDVNANDDAVVSGRGTIYAAGVVRLHDSARICGIVGCTSSWNPAASELTFVALGTDANGYSFILLDSAKFQGGVWAEGGYWGNDYTAMYGPVVANTFRANDTARVPGSRCWTECRAR